MKICFILLAVVVLHGNSSEGYSIENEQMLEEFISLLNDLIDILNELILLLEPPNGQINQNQTNSTDISIVLLPNSESDSVSHDHFKLTTSNEVAITSTVQMDETSIPSIKNSPKTEINTDSSEETSAETTKVSEITNEPNQANNISSMTQVTQPIFTINEAKTDEFQNSSHFFASTNQVESSPTQSETSATSDSTTSQPTKISKTTPQFTTQSLIGEEMIESSTDFTQSDVSVTNVESSTTSTVIRTESIKPSETYDTTTITTHITTQVTTEGTDQPITPHTHAEPHQTTEVPETTKEFTTHGPNIDSARETTRSSPTPHSSIPSATSTFVSSSTTQTKPQTSILEITSTYETTHQETTTNQAITPHTHALTSQTDISGTELTTRSFPTTESPDLGGRRKRGIESSASINDMLSDLKLILKENEISNTTIEYLRAKVNELNEILQEYKDDPAASLKMKNDGWNSVTVRDIWKEATAVQKNLRKIKAMISKTLLNLDSHKFLLIFVLLIVLGAMFIFLLICLLVMNKKIFIISHLMRSAGLTADSSLPQSNNHKNSRSLPSNYESEEFPRNSGYSDLPICNAMETEGYSSYHLRHPTTFEHWVQPKEENRFSRECEDQPYGEAFNNYNNRERRNRKLNNGTSFEYKGPEEPLTDYSPPRKGILRRFDPITLNPLTENSKF